MKDYGRVRGDNYPQEITMTLTEVMVASNVQFYEEEDLDGRISSGYEYDYKVYSKDEYYASTIAALQEELAATKILLGVE